MRTSTARVVQLVLLILLALLVLTPLLWLVSTSLKGPAEDIFSSPPALLPAQPSLDAYVRLFQDNPLTTYLFNSTVVSGLAVLANLLFCSLAAYPLARLRFAGRGLVLGLVVATILIPFQVVMIPLYLLMVQLGLRNTLLALVIPQAATAFGLYLLRQSFLGVPKELEEAARIDAGIQLLPKPPQRLQKLSHLPERGRVFADMLEVRANFGHILQQERDVSKVLGLQMPSLFEAMKGGL